jgi:hypothetical protein
MDRVNIGSPQNVMNWPTVERGQATEPKPWRAEGTKDRRSKEDKIEEK